MPPTKQAHKNPGDEAPIIIINIIIGDEAPIMIINIIIGDEALLLIINIIIGDEAPINKRQVHT